MVRHRRNNVPAGFVLLVGALLMAAGSTLPWGEFDVVAGLDQPPLPYNGHHIFGFDQTIAYDGSVSNFGPVLLIVSGAVALSALALFATRIRGLGAAWRVMALGSLVPVTRMIGSLWSIFDETPGTDLARTDSAPVRAFGVAMQSHAVTSDVGPGLMIISLGFGMVALGALIPASRSQQVIRRTPATPPVYGDWLKAEARLSR
ncbi:MAG: hypothetical protein QOE23_2111 [Pseudonocardiales bacterium]|jgi:hypothetical protein|nr:hypothetical protein [Pseudonocardiales bacterium]